MKELTDKKFKKHKWSSLNRHDDLQSENVQVGEYMPLNTSQADILNQI